MSFKEIILRLDEAIRTPDAKVALISEHVDETSMLATREGYLRLARDLVALVQAADEGTIDEGRIGKDKHGQWDDDVKYAFYHFACFDQTGIIGAYILPNHSSLLAAMARFFGPRWATWMHDPQFDPPEQRQDHERQ